MTKVQQTRSWRGPLLALSFGFALVFAAIILAEGAVRVFCPYVTSFGSDRELFDRQSDQQIAWRPNATGAVFGQQVSIDEHGCRRVGVCQSPQSSWLILGDSVAFGPGVEDGRTFAGKLQETRPRLKVVNAAVVGMNLEGYRQVAERFLTAGPQRPNVPPIDKVTLFYCLNDLLPEVNVADAEDEDAVPLDPRTRPSWLQSVVQFLNPRSRLFVLLKSTLTRPYWRYFEMHRRAYEEIDSADTPRFADLRRVAELARQAGAEFEIIVLPYAHQCRSNTPGVWVPQQKLIAYLQRHQIAYRDARDWFIDGPADNPLDYYLFGDPMHLSAKGHEVVFDQWIGADETPRVSSSENDATIRK